jgi:peptide/nickel transport system permease protein
MKIFFSRLRLIVHYPSVVAGVTIVLALIGISIYALIAIPYPEAIRLWRGGEEIWYKNPKTAQPAWVNYFRKDKLPVSFSLSTKQGSPSSTNAGSVTKTIGPVVKNTRTEEIIFTFDFSYNKFPQGLVLFFTSQYATKPPFVSMVWLTPDGREIQAGTLKIDQTETYRFNQDTHLQRTLNDLPPEQGLFAASLSQTSSTEQGVLKTQALVPIQGTYQLMIKGVLFDENSKLDAEFVFYGQVYGLAGTDRDRRDLMVALLWGTPIALAFGLLAAFGTSFMTMAIAATGAWLGGLVDNIIQRITEVNIILPILPILIMVGTFYSRSIWAILGSTILLSIFTGGIKTYRAIFMQVKQSPYIEAALAYNARNFRIVFRYIIPPIIPTLIPQLVTLIPGFVFLEASLAVLGLGDPILPTWGKIIQDAQVNGALYQGQYYWVLEPTVLLMLTGLAFAMVGFALDRVFNPKLRGL